jgi:integrase
LYLIKAKRVNPESGKKDDYYRIGWREGETQKTRAIGFVSKKEAERLLMVAAGKQAAGEHLHPKPVHGWTVTKTLDEMLLHLAARGLAGSTQTQAAHCRKALDKHLGSIEIADLRGRHLDQYVLTRREEKVRSRTIQIELSYLRQALVLALEEGHLKELPRLPRIRIDDARPATWLRPEQRQLFADALPWSAEPISSLAIYALVVTAARKNEVLGLRWSDVDLVRGSFTFGHTKTRAPRTIPIPTALLGLLRDHYERLGRPCGDAWVFPSGISGKPLRDLRHAMESTCKRAGLPTITIHGLRHSWATAAAHQPEIARPTVQLVGGWRDAETLAKVYTHAIPETSRQAVEQLSVLPPAQAGATQNCYPLARNRAAG